MTSRNKGGRGLGRCIETEEEERKRRRISREEADEREGTEFGRYGVAHSKDCETCGGTGDAPNGSGEMCSDCMCGSCTQEKYFCGGCDYYSFDEESEEESGSESEKESGSESEEEEKKESEN